MHAVSGEEPTADIIAKNINRLLNFMDTWMTPHKHYIAMFFVFLFCLGTYGCNKISIVLALGEIFSFHETPEQ